MPVELQFSIAAVPSTLRVAGGREIPFVRAILSLRNTGDTIAAGVVPHATLSEERGLVHDATESPQARRNGGLDPAGRGAALGPLRSAPCGSSRSGQQGSPLGLQGGPELVDRFLRLGGVPGGGRRAPVQTGVSRWKLRWNPTRSRRRKRSSLSMEAVEAGRCRSRKRRPLPDSGQGSFSTGNVTSCISVGFRLVPYFVNTG